MNIPEPAKTFLLYALVAFVGRFLLGGLPLIGGLISSVLTLVIVVGVVVGVFYLVKARSLAAD